MNLVSREEGYYNGKYPKTKEEWWLLVDIYWADLVDIVARFIPIGNFEKISETKGEVVFSDVPVIVTIERLKQERNTLLARYFFAAWDAAPDNRSIHSIKNWGLLCDLLSEEYVLYGDDQK